MKVLVVEDSRWSSWQEITESLKNHKEIQLSFCDLKHAANVLGNFNIDVCVIDACSGPNRQTSTAMLAGQIKKYFKGVMIAVSGIPFSRIPLLKAGCTYACSKGTWQRSLLILLPISLQNA